MLKSEADKIDRFCRVKYTYEVTPFSLTHWRSHRAEVQLNEAWSGPCGDLTSTVLDFVTSTVHERDPAALSDCYRLLVSLEHADKPDHMIGCVYTSDGGYVIVGDTTRAGAYSKSGMVHRPIAFGRMSEAAPDQVWHEGVPW